MSLETSLETEATLEIPPLLATDRDENSGSLLFRISLKSLNGSVVNSWSAWR